MVSFLSPLDLPAQEITHGIPGTSIERAVVNFTELARQEALSPAVPDKPGTVPPFMSIPENLPVPESIVPPLSREKSDALKFQQAPAPLAASPSASKSFSALGDNNNKIPPDTHGAVGPNHLMVTLNTEVRIQDRSGNTIGSIVSLSSFWSALGSVSPFDPKVLYDHLSDRWIFTACANVRADDSSQLIGVSQTNDPTGNWNLFQIDGDASDLDWVDYPSMGYNKDWIVVSVNLFTIAADSFQGTNIYVFDKSDLYNNVDATYTLIQTTSNAGSTYVPAITYDSSLAVIYLLNRWSSGAGTLYLYQISGSIGSKTLSFIGSPTSTENWGSAVTDNFLPQRGSSTGIMANDSRLHNVVYRNGTLWTVHHIFLPTASPTRSSIQWWEINTDASVAQRGRIDDSSGTNFYAFPSIAVNKNNDVLIGYSSFSSSQYASASYSFRYSTDAADTLRDDTILKAGTDTYIKDKSTGQVRWGDYSNTVVDPANDTDMWTIQQYAETGVGTAAGDDRWGTWWGKIKLATDIPTLSEWGNIIFVLLLFFTGAWFIIYRKAAGHNHNSAWKTARRVETSDGQNQNFCH